MHTKPFTRQKVKNLKKCEVPKVITPLVLGYMSIANLVGDIRVGYGDYPADALFYFGWFLVVIIVVIAFIFQTTGAINGNIKIPVKSLFKN